MLNDINKMSIDSNYHSTPSMMMMIIMIEGNSRYSA